MTRHKYLPTDIKKPKTWDFGHRVFLSATEITVQFQYLQRKFGSTITHQVVFWWKVEYNLNLCHVYIVPYRISHFCHFYFLSRSYSSWVLNEWKKRKRKKNTSKKLSKFNVTGKLKESDAQKFFIKYNFEESTLKNLIFVRQSYQTTKPNYQLPWRKIVIYTLFEFLPITFSHSVIFSWAMSSTLPSTIGTYLQTNHINYLFWNFFLFAIWP